MTHLVESVISRHFPKDESNYSHKRLTGGISSETYRVEPNSGQSAEAAIALTIIRDPLLWWKVEQEFALRDLIAGDTEVPLPQLFDAGFDDIDGTKIAYILREFVKGEELDVVLGRALRTRTKEQDFSSLAADLGYRLGTMHRHGVAVFGQLAKSREALYPNWASFVLSELANEVRLTSQLPTDKQLGRIKVSGIHALLPALQKLVGSLQSSLLSTITPHLGHGDAHFKNIIAGKDASQAWRVKSFIDTEEALGGDPEIDVAYIENWLHFSSYKDEFFRKQTDFFSQYTQQRSVGERYKDRRLIYHALRSLSFLRTVFEFDAKEFLSAAPKNSWYVFQHFQILHSLSEGNALEDINIPQLL